MKILIVEDDCGNLEALSEYLCWRTENKCDGVKTIDKAISNIKSNHYDVVLLDLLIQNQKSDFAIPLIRNFSLNKSISICLMSGFKGADKIAIENKVDVFLSKPFDIDIIDNFFINKEIEINRGSCVNSYCKINGYSP